VSIVKALDVPEIAILIARNIRLMDDRMIAGADLFNQSRVAILLF
jgi:hypothetical protein